MPDIIAFQKKLLSDPKARAAFAANPKQALLDAGIKMPEGLDVPEKLDPKFVEERLTGVQEALKEEGTTVEDINKSDSSTIARFAENAVPLTSKNLSMARAVHQGITTKTPVGQVETAAAVAVAVVVAVVALPVAAAGMTDRFSKVVLPTQGIEKLSRVGLGMTIHGPEGLRIDGATVNEVAEVIRLLRNR